MRQGYLTCLALAVGVCAMIYYFYTNREQQGAPLPFSKLVRPTSYAMFSAIIGTMVTHDEVETHSARILKRMTLCLTERPPSQVPG
jgi:hypothetical protein